MAEIAAGRDGLEVDQQPDTPGGGAHHIKLTGTQKWYVTKPELPGSRCGERCVQIIGGGEHHTDQVVVPKLVAREQFTEQLHEGTVDLVGVIPLDSCGTPQGSHWHVAMLPIAGGPRGTPLA